MPDHEHPEIHDRIDRVAELLEKHVVDSENRHKEGSGDEYEVAFDGTPEAVVIKFNE